MTDKEIIEHLNFLDFYEASYLIKKLKKENANLKLQQRKELDKGLENSRLDKPYKNSDNKNHCDGCGKELKTGTVFCKPQCREHYYN